MQNCLSELIQTYCLIYLDDMIFFSKMEEEHLHHLCIVFECYREHNLKAKPTKYEFLKNKIYYLSHHIWPSKKNLKGVAGFAPSQTYPVIQAFFELGGTFPTIY